MDDDKVFTDSEIANMFPFKYNYNGLRAIHYNGIEPLKVSDEEYIWETKYGYARVYRDRFVGGKLLLPQKRRLEFWLGCDGTTTWRFVSNGYVVKEDEIGIQNGSWCDFRKIVVGRDERLINRVKNLLADKPKPRCEFDSFMYNRLRIAIYSSEYAHYYD
jgi:hypothetical protein